MLTQKLSCDTCIYEYSIHAQKICPHCTVNGGTKSMYIADFLTLIESSQDTQDRMKKEEVIMSMTKQQALGYMEDWLQVVRQNRFHFSKEFSLAVEMAVDALRTSYENEVNKKLANLDSSYFGRPDDDDGR